MFETLDDRTSAVLKSAKFSIFLHIPITKTNEYSEIFIFFDCEQTYEAVGKKYQTSGT